MGDNGRKQADQKGIDGTGNAIERNTTPPVVVGEERQAAARYAQYTEIEFLHHLIALWDCPYAPFRRTDYK